MGSLVWGVGSTLNDSTKWHQIKIQDTRYKIYSSSAGLQEGFKLKDRNEL